MKSPFLLCVLSSIKRLNKLFSKDSIYIYIISCIKIQQKLKDTHIHTLSDYKICSLQIQESKSENSF